MILARKRLSAIEERLRTVEVQLAEVRDGRRNHELELEEMYEKLSRLYQRIRKRDERATQATPEDESEGTPCADPITDRVLKFREAKAHVLGQS